MVTKKALKFGYRLQKCGGTKNSVTKQFTDVGCDLYTDHTPDSGSDTYNAENNAMGREGFANDYTI